MHKKILKFTKRALTLMCAFTLICMDPALARAAEINTEVEATELSKETAECELEMQAVEEAHTHSFTIELEEPDEVELESEEEPEKYFDIEDDSEITVFRKDSTCIEEGFYYLKCEECNYAKKVKLPLADHDFDNGTEVKGSRVEATCLEEGYYLVKCANCDKTQKVTLDKLNHEFEEGEEVPNLREEATCSKDGYYTAKCKHCEATKKIVIPKTNKHDFENGTEVKGSRVEPTCTEDGYVLMKCKNCDKEEKVVLKATGHKYGEEKKENYTSSGYDIVHYCTICNHKEVVRTESSTPYVPKTYQPEGVKSSSSSSSSSGPISFVGPEDYGKKTAGPPSGDVKPSSTPTYEAVTGTAPVMPASKPPVQSTGPKKSVAEPEIIFVEDPAEIAAEQGTSGNTTEDVVAEEKEVVKDNIQTSGDKQVKANKIGNEKPSFITKLPVVLVIIFLAALLICGVCLIALSKLKELGKYDDFDKVD